MIQSYRDLLVWQKSVDLVIVIYNLTKGFPKSEMYGLSSQMQRAAVSIPSNIAEGYTRRNRKEYVQFCSISAGSAAELETQVTIAQRLYPELDYHNILPALNEVQKMLYALVEKLKVK